MERVDLWALERDCQARGHALVCGADEAGAGCLAGDVYAAAVILPTGLEIEGLDDSKKLTAKKREALFQVICDQAVAWSLGIVDVKTIEEINILNARMLAMERAIQGLSVRPTFALIDGNQNKGITLANQTVVGGDGKSASIAAASILAKVSRDRYMDEMGEQYPQYEFGRHKAYGTKLHYAKLEEFGASPIHRQSFLKKFYAQQGANQ